jgi:hypothetical protein
VLRTGEVLFAVAFLLDELILELEEFCFCNLLGML